MPKVARVKIADSSICVDVFQTAKILSKTENAIRCMVKKGKLRAVRVDGRVMFSRVEIEKYLAKSVDRTLRLQSLGNFAQSS